MLYASLFVLDDMVIVKIFYGNCEYHLPSTKIRVFILWALIDILPAIFAPVRVNTVLPVLTI